MLSADAVRNELGVRARLLLAHLDVFPRIDSTNARLLAAADEGADAGTVYIAAEQTAGRGRQGRRWFSPPGGSLSLSVLWDVADLRGMTGLSLAAGVAVARALKVLGVDRFGLKWPNDVLAGDRKLAGILVEARGGDRCVAVIGVGINLDFPERFIVDQPWTDLRNVLGRAPAASHVAGVVVNELLLLLPEFEGAARAAILDEWSRHDVLRGRRLRIERDGVEFTGIGRGINGEGGLLLQTERGTRAFASGDIRVRIDDPAG